MASCPRRPRSTRPTPTAPTATKAASASNSTRTVARTRTSRKSISTTYELVKPTAVISIGDCCRAWGIFFFCLQRLWSLVFVRLVLEWQGELGRNRSRWSSGEASQKGVFFFRGYIVTETGKKAASSAGQVFQQKN
ncbi:hypothetical protein MPH_02025 [Macrophomina phaseolina MS6]|uniref:Uncharacterized protein n=1 Tax=Macrophomina phaseolina (strain MS6) TaxID=1126212 RepID=K2SVP2_MACPH|nr:hypothetical protein MPH_02025 [Macrophomina phaseolina MS6]